MKAVINISSIRIWMILWVLTSQFALEAQQKLKFDRVTRMPRENIFFGNAFSAEKIFVLGGQTSQRLYSRDLQVYDSNIKKWLRIPLKELVPITNSSSIYIDEWDGFLFTGGLREEGAHVLLIDALTLIDEKNYRLKTVGYLPESAKNLGIARDSTHLYFFGGSTAITPTGYASTKVTFTSKCFCYELATGKTEKLPDLPVAMETTGTIVEDVLYTFGGYNGSSLSDIYAFDIVSQSWEKAGELDKSLSSNTVIPYNEKVIIVSDYYDTDQLLVYDTEKRQVYTFKMNIKGRQKGAAILDKELHIYGGTQSGLLSNQHHKIKLDEILSNLN